MVGQTRRKRSTGVTQPDDRHSAHGPRKSTEETSRTVTKNNPGHTDLEETQQEFEGDHDPFHALPRGWNARSHTESVQVMRSATRHCCRQPTDDEEDGRRLWRSSS